MGSTPTSDSLALTVERVFLACSYAVESGIPIGRRSTRDKEFHLQDWFKHRLEGERIQFDDPARNSYPDFRLIELPVGFELKGLGYPGREANYDCINHERLHLRRNVLRGRGA